MSFSDPFNVCKGLCLAATFTGFYDDGTTGTCDGQNVVAITDADIVFNSSGPFGSAWTSESEEELSEESCAGEVYLETVVTHEIGHLIGLGHEDGEVAVMNSSISSCNNQLLQRDDIAGRDALYACDLTLTEPCLSTCVNNLIECTEVCDGTDLSGESCETQGFPDGGTLSCNDSCSDFDTSSCLEPICNLFQKGDACVDDSDCCSNKCKGPQGGKSCK